jgi:cytochrome P450
MFTPINGEWMGSRLTFIIVLTDTFRAIHRDPALYPDPEVFNPRRWLSPEYPTYREPLEKYPNLQNFSAFGFGRRICPGMNIAERSLHLVVARLAWAFKIARRPGFEVPWYDYTTGFNVQPKKFVFDITPRSAEKAAYVERTWLEGKGRDPLNQS